MQTVSTFGLPSSNQLSGWTTRSGIRANGTIGPIAESGWISGPVDVEPVGEDQPVRAGRRGSANPCRRSQASIARGSAPGRHGSGTPRNRASSSAGVGSARGVDPRRRDPTTHPVVELAPHPCLLLRVRPLPRRVSRRRPRPPPPSPPGRTASRRSRPRRRPAIDPADQPLVPLEHHDPVAASSGPSTARIRRRSPSCFAADLLGPSTRTSTVRPRNAAVVFPADRVLDGEQVVVPPLLDLLGHVVGVKVVGLGPRAGAVLEDEAVLEPRPARPAGPTSRTTPRSRRRSRR